MSRPASHISISLYSLTFILQNMLN